MLCGVCKPNIDCFCASNVGFLLRVGEQSVPMQSSYILSSPQDPIITYN